MLAFSELIDFLLRLLADDDARSRFEQDPQGTLTRAGLGGVTGRDVRDALLQLADSGAVCTVDDGHRAYRQGGNDPVHEIGYTTAHYTAARHVVEDGGHGDAAEHHAAATVSATTTFLTIDDRDTLLFQSVSDDDVTITDNSVNVADAFNTDNSSVTAIQANNSTDLFNSDDDVVAIQDNDVNTGANPISVDTSAPDPAVGPADPATEEDAPAGALPVQDEPPVPGDVTAPVPEDAPDDTAPDDTATDDTATDTAGDTAGRDDVVDGVPV